MSLKAKALQYLAQRDHSRQELRLKLLRWHSRSAAVASGPNGAARSAAETEAEAETDAAGAPESARVQVDALLHWLVDKGLLSDERFTQSRVHARQARFGNRRITGELRQHGLKLDEEQLSRLNDSETSRALHILTTRFSANPQALAGLSPQELQRLLAKQQRFLATRGFSADAIYAALKDWRRADPA